VEENRPQAACVVDLVDRHRRGELEVGLLAASASENNRSRRFPGSAKLFKLRVENLGWDDLPIVPMPAIFGLSYFDFSFFVGDADEFEKSILALWTAMFPKISRDPAMHLKNGQILIDESIQSVELYKWRNAWCDVMSAYSHIHAKRDVFVTANTRDFQSKRDLLNQLGMKHICSPDLARQLVESLLLSR